MFNPTKNIVLEPVWQKIYFVGRVAILIFFLLVVLYFLKNTLFPSEKFALDFNNQKIEESLLGYEDVSSLEKIFSAYSKDNFSFANFKITAKKNQPNLTDKEVLLRKTYSAFAYPLSDQLATFPDRTLLQNNNDFFLVSNGKIRKFSSFKTLEALGYSQDNFQKITDEEIGYMEKGEEITDTQNYPDNSLFLIDGTYYELLVGALRPFVSEKAFLSHCEKNQALVKDDDFLKKYSINQDNLIGFANGTLLSFDIGVFLVEEGKVVPFNNPETFLALGYNWDDIISANEEEIGLYQRDKVFSISRPHPSGTVFQDQDSGKYYLISGKDKKEIRGENIQRIYLKRKPVLVNEKSLSFDISCKLEKKLWPFNSYGCQMPTATLEKITGKDYQFKLNSNSTFEISQVNIIFSREINWLNMRDIFSDIKQRLLGSYGYGETL
ncbi:MAG: hypothetical protein WC678_00825 [Parcubacteria group bacterium]|jgi:hypothetical protein